MADIKHTSVFVPPEVAARTGCFTTLPIRLNARDDLANEATDQFIKDWATYVGDGVEKVTHFSYSPVGNWASLIIPEASPETIGVLSYIFALGLIQDDIEEALDVNEADQSSRDLSGALDPADARQIVEGSSAQKLKELMSQCMLECIKIDKVLGIAMLDALRELWLEIAMEHSHEIPQNLDDYFKQRISNGGMRVYWPMIAFGTGLHITPEEHKLCEPLIKAATTALLLANDYFSYEREVWELETGKAQRIVSAVDVLVRSKNLSAEEGKAEVKRIIIEAEQDLVSHQRRLLREHPDMSDSMKRWMDAAAIGTAGNHYWLSATPRQRAWKTGQPPIQHSSEIQTNTFAPSEDSTSSRDDDGSTHHSSGSEKNLDTSVATSVSHDDEHFVSSPVEADKPVVEVETPDKAVTDGTAEHPAWKHVDKDLSDLALSAPSSYILSMPAKGVRTTFIESLNVWLHVPAQPLAQITSVINTLHNASLILDDIEDDSPLRRGRPATHKIFGQAQATNSATYMFVHATSVVQKTLSPASLVAMIEGLEVLFRGQSWDLYWRQNLICPTETDYITMIDQKTGGMFEMLQRLMIAESAAPDTSSLPDLTQLTRLLGRYFQIRDDYMNLGEYTAQKGFGEDLDEGKFSFPIVYCLENHPEYRGQILSIFRQRRESPLSKEVKTYMIECLTKSGALDQTLKYILDIETELEAEIERLEKQTGRSNPVLKLCLARLSMKQ